MSIFLFKKKWCLFLSQSLIPFFVLGYKNLEISTDALGASGLSSMHRTASHGGKIQRWLKELSVATTMAQ